MGQLGATYRANLGQVNVKWKSRSSRRGTNSHWKHSREVDFPGTALSKLLVVKSALKSLKITVKELIFCEVA